MNSPRYLRFLLPLALLTASSLLLRADDKPATPTPAPADKPAAEVRPADPAPAAPAPEQPAAVPSEPASPVPSAAPSVPATPQPAAAPSADNDEAEKLAEKAREEAEKIAEKAQADAEKAADEARAKAERIADEARAEAEKTIEKAHAQAERLAEKAHASAARVQEKIQRKAERARRHQMTSGEDSSGDRVSVMDDFHVLDTEIVKHDAVAVIGNLVVDGEVMNDAVSVMGNNTVNGTVHGNVVAVMGNLILGPKSVVDGDLVVVGGELNRDPGAVVKGNAQIKTVGPHFNFDNLGSWWKHGLKVGRPLAIGAHLGWLWIITGFSIAFYALLGLVFPGKIRSCGDKLVTEPGLAILAGVLGILALPVLFVLLCITIIGLPVALLVLPVGTLLIAMFGKAAIYGLVGRRVGGDGLNAALAVILGALIFVLLYLIPYVGLLCSLLVWFLGFGCAVLSIFSRGPKPPASVPPVMPTAPGTPAAAGSMGFAATAATAATEAAPPVIPVETSAVSATVAASVVAAAAPAVQVPITADTLPRAGFWIRVAAAFLDFMLVMFTVMILVKGLLHFELDGPGLMFLALAGYHAAMWKTRGTTIGGIICGLKVVRLDDKPIDWGVAVVRALTGFLSFIIAGLGFIWVAFDDSKQSWHDKVAGTTIVRMPKGTPLL